jgi:transcriptional regulator with XRE-family HTH domain
MVTDEQIGRNLSALRGDMSQKDLADRMRRRGFKWSQATVWAIEKGERPLRVTEAEAIGDVFDIHGNVLGHSETSFDRTMRARAIEGQLEEIAGLAYATFEAQRRMALVYDLIPAEERDEDITPELLARNAVDYALQGLARAEAHYRAELEVDQMMDGPFEHGGRTYHQAFLRHVREQIDARRRESDDPRDQERSDGVDQAES